MMNYEFLGQAVALIGGWLLVAGICLVAAKLSSAAVLEMVGWTKIWKALKLLRAHEHAEKKRAQGAKQ